MHLEDYEKNIKTLSSWFKTKLEDTQIELIYDSIRKMKSECFEDIVTKFISERRPTYGNFPTLNEIRLAWSDWERDHPESNKPIKMSDCDYCHGRGLIWGKQYGYVCVGRCPDCENWRQHVGTFLPIVSNTAFDEVWPWGDK